MTEPTPPGFQPAAAPALDDERLAFRQERDFGELISDAVSVVFAHARRFFPALLLVIAAPALIAGYAEALAQQNTELSTWSSVSTLFASVLGVLVIGGTYVYALLYDEGRVQDLSATTMWRGAASMFWPIVGVQFVFGLGVMGASFVLLLPALIAQSWVLGAIAGVIIVVGVLFLIPVLNIAMPVRIMEVNNALGALRRSYQLVVPHWGQTFGVQFVTNGVTMLITLSAYSVLGGLVGLQTGGELDSPLFIVAVIIATFGNVLYAVPAMSGLLQYHNLVAREQGPAVLEARVEQIGAEEEAEPLF